MKKGFTLIELLAVILILGIIALIAIPTVNNVIEESRMGAIERSAEAYVSAVETYATISEMHGNIVTGTLDVEDLTDLNIKQTLPESGTITVSNNEVISCLLVYKDYSIYCNDGNLEVVKSDEAPEEKRVTTLKGTKWLFNNSVDDYDFFPYWGEYGNGKPLDSGFTYQIGATVIEGTGGYRNTVLGMMSITYNGINALSFYDLGCYLDTGDVDCERYVFVHTHQNPLASKEGWYALTPDISSINYLAEFTISFSSSPADYADMEYHPGMLMTLNTSGYDVETIEANLSNPDFINWMYENATLIAQVK